MAVLALILVVTDGFLLRACPACQVTSGSGKHTVCQRVESCPNAPLILNSTDHYFSSHLDFNLWLLFFFCLITIFKKMSFWPDREGLKDIAWYCLPHLWCLGLITRLACFDGKHLPNQHVSLLIFNLHSNAKYWKIMN